MARKLNVPSIVGLDLGNMSFGVQVFLQAVQDALNTIDNNVVYKDSVSLAIPPTTIRAASAQGQSFSVNGTNLASGDDYVVLVQNFKTLLADHNSLREQVNTLTQQLRGQ